MKRGDVTGPLSRGVDALGAPWPDRPAREVEVPPRGAPMPADVDRVWDMCDVCGDLLAYCPEWRRRYPEVVEHQAREPHGW